MKKASSYYNYFRPIKTTLFSFSFIQKHFLQTLSSSSSAAIAPKTLCPLPTTPNSSSFTVQFLVNSCGLPLKSALSASQKLHLHENNIHKTHAVLQFLKSHHFDNTQIADLIKKRPTFLRCRVENNLKPKFEFLIANGFTGKLLPQLILSNPCISKRSLDSNFKLSFELLKSLLGSNEKLVVAVKRCSWLLHINNLKVTVQPNVYFLIKEGVPPDRVTKLFISYPRSLLHKFDRVVYAVNAVKTLGLEPWDNMFMHALAVRIQMTDTTWKKKIEVMKSLGWSQEEILRAFKQSPTTFTLSEEKIRRGIDFFMNTLMLGSQTIIASPQLFGYSIEKRLRPRHNVLEILVSEKLIFKEDMQNVHSLFFMSEKNFLQRYVTKYADTAPGLLDIYGVTSKAKR